MAATSDPYFHQFDQSIDHIETPKSLNDPFDYEPDALSVLAVEQIQKVIIARDWEHNFGLPEGGVGNPYGKMFGVLVVRASNNKIGFLAAFSGKIGGKNHFTGFVPPVYDGLKEGSFLNLGMQELSRINQDIKTLIESSEGDNSNKITELKQLRRDHSNSLQGRIFDNYRFLNREGLQRNLRELFEDTHHTNPPGGAGECAAPKLLQYAFQNAMTPLAIAEFFWGNSTKSDNWKHKEFYPACTHKCQPILKHMLSDLV